MFNSASHFLFVQIIRKHSQSSLSKEEINIFERDFLGLLEEEEDDGECDADVPC
jgi:hypothetical protein